MVVSGMIDQENVEPLCELLAIRVDYSFDDGDWAAIEHGISMTDAGRGVWFEYALEGSTKVTLCFAEEPGAGAFSVRIEADSEVERGVKAILFVTDTCALIPRTPLHARLRCDPSSSKWLYSCVS